MSLVAASSFGPSPGSAFVIQSSVISSGGSSSIAAGNETQRMVGTVGQAAVGMGIAGATVVSSGFWPCSEFRVEPPELDRPKVFAFTLVSSNPTRGPAQFELALPRASRVTLSVVDVGGRRMGDPFEQRLEAGRHRLTWGANLRHSGVYFLRLTTEAGFVAKRKIVLIR